jgi:hypothetical protein
MSLNKQKMVREIGRRTRLKNRDVQAVIEALVDVWTEELVKGGRIEIQGFFVLGTREIERYTPMASLDAKEAPQSVRRLTLRISSHLRGLLNH